jgi:hypothetical protein
MKLTDVTEIPVLSGHSINEAICLLHAKNGYFIKNSNEGVL